jgi:hypothetical protein
MANSNLIIPLDTDAYKQDAHAPVRGGGTRVVRAVPTALGILPIIWISHDITLNEAGTPVYNCLLLASKDPPVAHPGEISVEAFKAGNIPTAIVEW